MNNRAEKLMMNISGYVKVVFIFICKTLNGRRFGGSD
jgi:hypothetical protein